MQRKRMLLLFTAIATLFGVLFIRVGHHSLGWGGYISVDIVNPLKR